MPFALIAGSRFGNYKDGFRFGRLGYELVEKRGLTRYQARTYIFSETSSYHGRNMPWRVAISYVAPSMLPTRSAILHLLLRAATS